MLQEEANQFIRDQIANNDIVLFMKGTADKPQCGFSQMVVKILQHMNVEFKDINILTNPSVREEIKVYSSWPTIPQLYIKQEFIGGCDIVKELFTSGELTKKLEALKI
jgi:monothiol glutaredoxin